MKKHWQKLSSPSSRNFVSPSTVSKVEPLRT